MKPSELKLWTDALERSLDWDVYHTPSYGEVFEEAFGFQRSLLGIGFKGNAVAMPMLLRSVNALPFGAGLEKEMYDAVSPWYFGGPLYGRDNPDPPEKVATYFLTALDKHFQDVGVVASFIRFHPAMGNHVGWPDVIEQGKVAEIDLTKPWRDIVMGMSKACRNAISNARRRGITVRHDAEPESLQVFKDIYREEMDRKEAKDFYRFTDTFWSALHSSLYGHIEVFVASEGGEDVAASIQVHANGHCSDYLRVQRFDARGSNAHNLLVHHQIEWARSHGWRWYHLGGGRGGGEDTQFAFKASFTPDIRTFYTWKRIHLPQEYDELIERRRAFGAFSGEETYFPLYRAGISEVG